MIVESIMLPMAKRDEQCKLRKVLNGSSILVLLLISSLSVVIASAALERSQDPDENTVVNLTRSYLLVGGQNGTWFKQGQFPRLYQIHLQDYSVVQLTPVHSRGTVWGGGFNGSQWLVSGWGSDDKSRGPYLWLYDGTHVITEGSLDSYGEASTWSGGDIFSASYNGKQWLVSGLGSGVLPSYRKTSTNHMALGVFNGRNFTDLSSLIPHQGDEILYTNEWNGQYWLVGGGYMRTGVLLRFDGQKVTDLTRMIKSAVPSFGSVQSIEWNGESWLLGGYSFLASYDGSKFTDLTSQISNALKANVGLLGVNTISWNGRSWLIGGGTSMAGLVHQYAWLVSYTSEGFFRLTETLPEYVSHPKSSSAILSVAYSPVNSKWFLGGFADNHAILLSISGGNEVSDESYLVNTMSYVTWIAYGEYTN